MFTQEELVLYILAHTRRYKQNDHLLMKDQPAWKRNGLERKHIFRERQEQMLQHTELFFVNNIGYRSKIPFSVSESQVSQASSLLGNIFCLSVAHRHVGYRRAETRLHVIGQSFPQHWWHDGSELSVIWGQGSRCLSSRFRPLASHRHILAPQFVAQGREEVQADTQP